MDESGMVKTPGGAIISKEIMEGLGVFEATRVPYTTINNAAGVALTAAQVLQRIIRRTGAPGGGISDTLPTVAAFIAAVEAFLGPGNFRIGMSFRVQYQNNGLGQTLTIANGGDANWTLTGTMTIATATTKEFLISRTGVGTAEVVSMGAGGAP